MSALMRSSPERRPFVVRRRVEEPLRQSCPYSPSVSRYARTCSGPCSADASLRAIRPWLPGSPRSHAQDLLNAMLDRERGSGYYCRFSLSPLSGRKHSPRQAERKIAAKMQPTAGQPSSQSAITRLATHSHTIRAGQGRIHPSAVTTQGSPWLPPSSRPDPPPPD